MKLNDTHIWTLIIIAGLFTGLALNSLYGFLWLASFAGLLILVILIAFLIGIFVKGNRFFRIAGFLFFFFCLASICSFATLRLKYNSQKDCSEKVIYKLDSFYNYSKQYPSDINTLYLDTDTKQKFLKSQHYHVDPSHKAFTISFNVDGATTYTFHSDDKVWTYEGFEW